MFLNPGKCCFIGFGSNPGKSNLILEASIKIFLEEESAVFGVTIENRLTFLSYLKDLCKKIANKLNMLIRLYVIIMSRTRLRVNLHSIVA